MDIYVLCILVLQMRSLKFFEFFVRQLMDSTSWNNSNLFVCFYKRKLFLANCQSSSRGALIAKYNLSWLIKEVGQNKDRDGNKGSSFVKNFFVQYINFSKHSETSWSFISIVFESKLLSILAVSTEVLLYLYDNYDLIYGLW